MPHSIQFWLAMSIAIGLSCLSPLAGAAPILGVNLVGSDATRGTLGSSTIAGVPGFQQSSWNNIAGTDTASTVLQDTAGQSFTIASFGNVSATTASLGLNTTDGLHDANDQLMNGYVVHGVQVADKIDVTSIPASYISSGYSVILYCAGGGTYPEEAAIDLNRIGVLTRRTYTKETGGFDGTFLRATSTDQSQPTLGGNYFDFDNLTASSFTVLFGPSLPVGSLSYLNAFQIVQTPEPSAGLLTSAGLLLFAALRRRNPRSC